MLTFRHPKLSVCKSSFPKFTSLWLLSAKNYSTLSKKLCETNSKLGNNQHPGHSEKNFENYGGTTVFKRNFSCYQTAVESHKDNLEVFLPTIKLATGMKDKVVLVTGGADGVGFQCAKELLGCGVKAVMIADMDEDSGKEVIDKLCDEFGENKVAFIKTDIGDTTLLRNAFNWTVNHFCSVDIVINSVKYDCKEYWEKQIDRNIKGVVRGTLLAFEYMGRHNEGPGGTVINICSTPSTPEGKMCPIYAGTRNFIMGFGRTIAMHYYKQTCVKVMTVCSVEPTDNSTNSSSEPPSSGCDLATVLLKGKNGSVWTP